MLITLVCEEKMYSLRLSEKIAGQFWIVDSDKNAGENRILSVDANTDEIVWEISSNKNVHIYDAKDLRELSKVKLEIGKLFLLKLGKKQEEKAFLFAEPLTEDRCRYVKYVVADKTQLSIGSDNSNEIIIKNPFVSAQHASLTYNQQIWSIKDNASSNGIYVNGKRIHSEYTIKAGDCIFIMGFKMVFGREFFAINNPGQSVEFNTNKIYDYVKQQRVAYETPEIEETEYYYRSPDFRRKIEPLKLKIDLPTQKEYEDDTPIILTLAPALMMGVASLASGIATTVNAIRNGGDFTSTIPTLIMSVSMLCGMVLFPLIMKKREQKRKIKKNIERQEKYLKYLNNIRFEIEKNKQLQKEILLENHPDIFKYLSMQDFWERKLWNRTNTEEDFLTLRLGIGNRELEAELNFPENRFSIDEDTLRKALIDFSEEKQIITDVPLCISMMKDRILGIYGTYNEIANLLNNLLLQIACLYSYDEVKLVFLCDERDIKTFGYVRWLQHIWDNEEKVRFFATNEQDIKEVNAILNKVILERMDDEKAQSTPYYLVVSTSKRLADKCTFISDICGNEKLQGVGFIAAYPELKNLPKECKSIIQLYEGRGLILRNDSVSNQKDSFIQDRINLGMLEEVVKRITDFKLDLQQGKYALPGMLTFMDMYNVGNIEHLNIRHRWKENNPVMSLQAPIGVDTGGEVFYLDLHEKFHGPHGLVAGMTGSGKSEFIITYILSMAINYHPDEVAFVLIDYKGGGLTGAFENEKYRLPHLAGTITNLDGAAITRSILSIKSELRRRQSIFNKARNIANEGTMDIYKYQKMYRSGIVSEPVPHLFIISDEFAELKTQQPEFMEQLISTARIGRSLGVHLILATQKPSGVVNEQIWANSKFKICLKVQDKSDSMDMLKRADAAEIAETGRFYLQVGYNEIFQLGQSAWSGAPYIERNTLEENTESSIEVLDNLGNVVEDIKVKNETLNRVNGKQIIRILEELKALADEEQIYEKQLWLPEIPEIILLDEVQRKYKYQKKTGLCAVIGELDDPYCQSQELLLADFSENGNAVVYGVSGSGKEKFLITMLYSLYTDYSAKELNTYILDFGAETLRMFENAPQTGDVIVDGENDRISGLIAFLYKEIEMRKKMFSAYGGSYQKHIEGIEQEIPYILVVINNYSQFMDDYEKYDDDLISLTRDCTKYGIYFVITETTVNGIRHRMSQNLSQTYVLSLNDKTEYISVLGSTGGVYPPKIVGRGIIKKEETYVFQTASIVETNESVNCFIRDFCKHLRSQSDAVAKKIPVMPAEVSVEDMMPYLRGLSQVPLGIAGDDFQCIYHDFTRNCVLQILSYELEDSTYFAKGIQEVLSNVKDVEIIVFNSDMKEPEKEIIRLFEIAVERNNNYKRTNGNPTVDMHPIVCIFKSVFRMKSVLSEDGYSKLYNILDKSQGTYNLAYFIFDDVMSANRYSAENWYQNQCKGNGIWVGQGLLDQMRLQINRRQEASANKEVDESFGFYVEKGRHRMMKLVTKDYEKGEK